MKKFSLILASLVLLVSLASGWGSVRTVEAFDNSLFDDSDFSWNDNANTFIDTTIMNNDGYIYASVYTKGIELDGSNAPVMYAVDKITPVTKFNAIAVDTPDYYWQQEGYNKLYIFRLDVTKKDEYFSNSTLYAGLPANKPGTVYDRQNAKGQTFTWLCDISEYGEIGDNPWLHETPQPEPDDPGNPFKDVPKNSYYRDAVVWAYENDITTGKSATSFDPEGKCKRKEVVTFLWRAAGKPEPSAAYMNKFSDVEKGSFYEKAVAWAVENEITTGKGNAFKPDDICKREEIVTFLWRANNKPSATATNNFTDVQPGQYYTDAVAWAVENGVTQGTGSTFKPADICKRCQVVTFIYRDANNR